MRDRIDASYLRLSKEDGDVEAGTLEESCSIQSQRACIAQYINTRSDLGGHFEEFVDDGFTGTNMNRPAMQRLLKLVEAGKVRTIIVRDLSRFARDYLEAGHYLEFVFPTCDVRFISINDHFDSSTLGESTGGLELAIRNLMNQMYSRDISRKIKSSVDLKKKKGEYVYGTAPYGYRKGPKKNTIIIDDEAAVVVKRIFTWASDGVTITQIARRLNEAGVTSPSVYLAAVRGKYKTRAFWTYESIRNILHNRIYTGDTEPFKSSVVRVGSNRVTLIPEEKRMVIPCTHDAIISRELYYQARLTIKSNVKSRRTSPPNPLTSYLVCGCCGNKLAKGKPQNKNWLCASARYNPDCGCKDVRINEARVLAVLLRAIQTQCQLIDAKIKQSNSTAKNSASGMEFLRADIRKAKKQISRYEQQRLELYEQYTIGRLTKENYISEKRKIANTEEQVKMQCSLMEKQLAEDEEEYAAMRRQATQGKAYAKYLEITEITPDLMRELVKKITVYPGNVIDIKWNFHNEFISIMDRIEREREQPYNLQENAVTV